MTEKDVALDIINALPKKASMDDIMHSLYLRKKFNNGEKEIKQKKGVSQAVAKKRLGKW